MMTPFLLLCVLAAASAKLNAPAGTAITNLPSYNGPPLSMHSGYITVNQTHGRALFYWLVEATKVDPATAPLVFWYQGGPGCSGLGGLMSETGPFKPNPAGGLEENPIAWTHIANVVFLEQPAFVGFSYSNTSSDANTNDVVSAEDNYAFVRQFLELYPDYKGRKTWLTGESYAGEYVPSLLNLILSDSSTQIYKQISGIMVGNPVFFCGTMQNVTYQLNLFYWHGLVSYSNYQQWFSLGCTANENSNECQKLYNLITKEVGVIDQELKRDVFVPQQPSLDPDCLYQDFCTGNGTLNYVATVPVNCKAVGDLISDYLNRADVQAAIHAKGANGGKPAHWSECTNNINYSISGKSMVPLYAKFKQQKPSIEILIYSGDIDIATVPFAFTQPCLAELKAKNTRSWAPWFVNGQTAGYWESFDLYTFATVKGGGHEAPQYQPLSSFNMFKRFMETQSLKDPSGAQERIRARMASPRLTQGRALRNALKKHGLSMY